MKTANPSHIRWKWVFIAAAALAISALIPAFFNREIHNDEAWIGQQVWSLEQHGKVESELFRDCPPLDREIVIYHKLLIWSGLAVSNMADWGLFQLRSISFLAGLLTLALVFWHLTYVHDPQLGWRVVAILLFTPIFWLQMLEFRPEALLLLCGFASYLIIVRALKNQIYLLFAAAGLAAGMAGLTHAFGFVFVIAGFAALLVERKWLPALTLLVFGLIGFAPYVSSYFTNRELFIEQTIRNPLMTTSFNLTWWQPFVNLITEHKRVLRKPEVIGITVWLLLALPFVLGTFWRRNRFTLVYLTVTAIVLAASPLPKFTRYMIPLVPLMAITVGQVWLDLEKFTTGWRRQAATAFRLWAVVFFAYGAFALVKASFPQQESQIEVNSRLAEQMHAGSLVMAPFDFVFMQRGKFVIQSWWGAERAAGVQRSVSFLEQYAESLGVQYLIIDPVIMKAWRLQEEQLSHDFRRYRLAISLPNSHRYLLSKVNDDTRAN